MNKNSNFFIFNKTVTGVLSALTNGICTVYLLKRGFSILAISSIFSISLLVSTLLEYPSGNIADKFGRKKTYSVGLFFRALQCFIFVIADNMILLYMSAVCEGIYGSFISGSLEGWLKGSETKDEEKPMDYSKVFGLSKSISSIFSIVLLLSISIFLKVDLKTIYVAITILYLILATFNLIYLKDNKGNQKNTLDYTIATVKEFFAKPKFQFLTFILSSTFAFISIYMIYIQPKAISVGLSESSLPLVSSINLLGGSISSYIYSRYRKKFGYEKFILVSFIGVLMSFTLFLVSYNPTLLMISNFCYGLSLGSLIPIFFSWSMQMIEGDLIASMLSFMSAISTIIASITTFFVGFIINLTNLNYAMYVGIILALISLAEIIYLYYFQRSNSKSCV